MTKCGVLDIRADLDTGEICNIEMQVLEKADIQKRILFYWSKLYFSSIQYGNDYGKLNKTIAILIANFELKDIEDIPLYHTKWEIREEKYLKKILTEMLEIHIIELPKLMKELNKNNISKNDKVALWAQFIINPEMIGEEIMSENKDIKKANEVLEEIQEDKQEQYLAHLRQKYILDKKAEEKFQYQKGMQEGLDKGVQEGFENGIKSTQREIILNMYKEKLDVEDICRFTKLSKEEVEKIIKEVK